MEQGYFLCFDCKKRGKHLVDCPRCTPYEYGWSGKFCTLPIRSNKYRDPHRVYDDRVLTIRKSSGEALGTFSMPTATHCGVSAKPFAEVANLNGPAIPDGMKYQWIRQNTLRYDCLNRFGSAL